MSVTTTFIHGLLRILSNKNMFMLSFLRKKFGFTLVELLVVITILAILALVSFVVFSQQSSQARDTNRIANIRNLHDGARMAVAQVRDLPLPENPVILSVSGTQIGWQWYVGSDLASFINYSNTILDPVDGDPYTYRLSQTRDRSQFLVHLENGFTDHELNLVNSSHLPFSRAYAYVDNLSDRYPYAWWDRLGIVLDHDNNLPVQNSNVASGGSWVAIDLASTGASSLYRIAVNENIKICSLTGALLDAVASSSGLDDRIASSILSESDVIWCGIAYANEGGSGVSPDTPSLALSPGNSQISVSWSLSSGATSYTLAYSTSPSWSYTEIPNLTSTGYVHTGLTNGSTYYYKIKAVGASGESVYSSIASAISPIINYAGQISVWPSHACAVKFDGTLACWYSGGAPVSVQTIPGNATNVVKVLVLPSNTCVLKSDRSVLCWWVNNDIGWTSIPNLARNNVVDIFGYSQWICAQRYDDLLLCWWQTGYGWYANRGTLDIHDYTWAMWYWGTLCFIDENQWVQCSIGDSYASALAAIPLGLSQARKISVSDRTACVVESGDHLACWWNNSYGQTDIPAWLWPIASVSVWEWSVCAITNTWSLSCWGMTNAWPSYFAPVNSATGVIAVSNYAGNMCMIREATGLSCFWSSWLTDTIPSELQNTSNHSSYALDNVFRPDAQISATKVRQNTQACALKTDMTVACWWSNDVGQSDVPNNLSNIIDIAVAQGVSCALASTGWVTCWGHPYMISNYTNPVFTNRSFQSIDARHVTIAGILQDGTPVSSYAPFTSTGASMITAGSHHACLVRTSDGSIECRGGFVDSSVITPPAITGVTDISAGESHTCAVKPDGTVACWWSNYYGQISVPVGLDNVVKVRSWDQHTCALKWDGTMICWWRVIDMNYGFNLNKPIGLQNIADFSFGWNYHFCATQTNGAIVCSLNGYPSSIVSWVPSN